MRVTLTKDEVRDIFDSASDQADYVLGLYKLIFDKAGFEWDDITSVNHFPKAADKISDYIWKKAQEWDKKYAKEFFPAGAWLNNGFSTDSELPENIVEVDETVISMQGGG